MFSFHVFQFFMIFINSIFSLNDGSAKSSPKTKWIFRFVVWRKLKIRSGKINKMRAASAGKWQQTTETHRSAWELLIWFRLGIQRRANSSKISSLIVRGASNFRGLSASNPFNLHFLSIHRIQLVDDLLEKCFLAEENLRYRHRRLYELSCLPISKLYNK